MELTIVTKDGDFDLLINNLAAPPPKPIKLTIGNMLLQDFISFLRKDWGVIVELSKKHKVVVANESFIEAFD